MKAVRISRQRGFNLIEVLIAVFILIFMALMFAAVVPTSLRSVHSGNYYNLAAIIAQRKMDQLMDPGVGYKNLTVAQLKNTILSDSTTGSVVGTNACEWYDPAPTSTGTGPVTNGDLTTAAKTDYRLVGYFTKIDKLRSYKENGTDVCSAAVADNAFPGDSDVVGKMEISGWQGKTSSSTDSQVLQVTITITWRTNGQGKSTYVSSTLIPKKNIL